MVDIKQEIINIIKKEVKADIELEVPPDSGLGDYALPCFSLAKIFKKNPDEIAQDLTKKIHLDETIEKIEVKGPYVNFFINKNKLIENTLRQIIKEKQRYGSGIEKNKKALVEHTSINPNASPHVGRARNALIGDALARLLKFQGYKTDVHYYVNDIGKQIAILLLGAGNRKKIGFDDLLKLYIKSSKKAEEKKFEQDVFQLLKKLEQGDKKIKKRFRDVVNVCIQGQKRIFSELGIRYDHFDFESKYLFSKETNNILKRLEKTGKVFTDEDGRKVLDQKGLNLAMKTPVLVLTRGDGTSLYVLRDLAYTIEKMKKTKHNYWVLGEDHKLYYQQIKAALSLLGYKAPRVIYYSFVLLKEGKMSTRKGNLVLLEEFMKEAVKKAEKEILKRNKKISKKILAEEAKSIGYGAVKYAILKVSPEKNVIFDWEKALAFEGDTGPYLQYAYARICSILRKSETKINYDVNYALLKQKEEIGLVKKLSEFRSVIEQSTKQLRPHLTANYLYGLAQSLSEFYHSCQVLKEREDLKKARLLLIYCVKQVLENGLNLLGIDVLESM